MSTPASYPRYGVRMANQASDSLDEAVETIALLGYAVVDSGLGREQIEALRARFAEMHEANHGRRDVEHLRAIGEVDLLRCPLADDRLFLALAGNPRILSLCERLMGPGFILNQQNGIVNPAGAKTYSQSSYHRDLPYQHFVSSRPLAINALFCLDPFTIENGATHVIPASHKQEAFPSDHVIASQAKQISAPAGSFLVLDCMIYHCGGTNRSAQDRRAVNHVYTIAMMRQQIDLAAYLGDDFTADPKIRQLLGFNHPSARSVDEFVSQRKAR
jgi:ectoine hydroxylase-related dioxygenase (phytanoyl-CoA dioxygenase family)